VILKGVHIGKGAIVGAGSVVTKSIPAGEAWAGVPARRLRASETLLQPSHPNSQTTHS
jgi:acetyltransferase-like isoleucine patch superfamily enzyme